MELGKKCKKDLRRRGRSSGLVGLVCRIMGDHLDIILFVNTRHGINCSTLTESNLKYRREKK